LEVVALEAGLDKDEVVEGAAEVELPASNVPETGDRILDHG
jgi:hypothetical protein